MTNLPLWLLWALRTIVESVSCAESMSDWGTNPPPATKKSFLSSISAKPARLDYYPQIHLSINTGFFVIVYEG
jgi:hypothetical protein